MRITFRKTALKFVQKRLKKDLLRFFSFENFTKKEDKKPIVRS